MADNQAQTIPAPVGNQPPAIPTTQVQQTTPMGTPPMTFEVPQDQLGPAGPVRSGSRAGGFVEKLRTPVAAAAIGGFLLLGVGFATGYVVGHDQGASSTSSTTDGQTGFPGGQGGFGGQRPGQGQTGQGQTGTGQDQSGTGTSPFGPDQSQQFGPDQSQGWTPDGTQDDGTQDSTQGGTEDGTTTQDGLDLSQTQ